MMNSEIWKDIKGYEGYYQVSNEGGIRGVDRYIEGGGNQNKRMIKGIILKNHISNAGYYKVRLSKNGKSCDFSVHRLVMITFKTNEDCSLHVNHINGIKDDNRLENLEWCNAFENMKHAEELGLVNNKGVNSPNNVYSEKQILQVKQLLQTGYKYKEITELTGVTRHTIYKIKNRKQWCHLK